MNAIAVEPMSTSRPDLVPLRVEHTDEMVVVLTVGRSLLEAGGFKPHLHPRLR
jgi:hypothetical protein